MREGFSHDCGQYLSNENLASLGNENQEDYSSIDLLQAFGFGVGVGAIAYFFKNRKDSYC